VFSSTYELRTTICNTECKRFHCQIAIAWSLKLMFYLQVRQPVFSRLMNIKEFPNAMAVWLSVVNI